MPWWGVLLMVIGCQGIFILVWWLINRKSTSGDLIEVIEKLESSNVKRLNEELEAEKKAKGFVEDAYKALSVKYKEVASWYNDNRSKIEENADASFKELAKDPSAIDSWLDGLLKPTSPQPDNPNTEDGEG